MAETNDSVFLDEKMDLVTFGIKVDQEDISKEYQVTGINVYQGINKIPEAEITIIDGQTDKEDFEISSSGEFTPGKEIEIQLGYEEENNTVFKGIIVTNTHRVTNNYAELIIECKHETVNMTINKSNSHFKQQISASDVADELLSKNNIKNTNIDSSSLIHPQLLQSNVSDWDFMIGQLDAAGMICLINNDQVNIKKPALDADPVLKLTYGKNILEFNGDKDTRIQSESVKTYTWDFKNQQVVIKENDDTGSGESGNEDSDSKPVPYEIRTSANKTEDELAAISTTKKLRQELSKIKANVKYPGVLTANPGDFIELEGVGQKFNGKAFVSAINHDYREGTWTTEASLGWDELFFSEQINPTHPASEMAQPSRIQGLQIAIVTSIEDEEGQYRVKVKLPLVDENADGMYARVATLDAGDNRGTFFRPEVGDEVVVGFLNGDPSNPVILGMLHSGQNPAPLEPESSNNKKGYVSRESIKMIFDDGDKKLTIETPGSRVFELDDSAGTITIKDDNGNKIIMDQSGISIEAGKSITLKAGTELNVQASSQISVKADAALSLEGSASSSINSSGVTEIKGSLVKIN